MLLVLVLAAVVCAASYTDEALNDQIVKLPGSENLSINFNQFSGYLSLANDVSGTKHLHYWLVESMSDPASDPLAFW
jgi:cathepsin A (carboxypeptidase C)